MQILISVIVNIIILAVVIPLFYIYIVSKARERLERETMKKAREEIEALVKEFNNIALNRISLLEDAITRANKLNKELNDKAPSIEINNNKIDLNANIKMKYDNPKPDEKKVLDIKVDDDNKKENVIENTLKTNTIETSALNIIVDDDNKKDEKNELKDKKDNEEKINSKEEEKTTNKYDDIKKINDNNKKEAIEKLRNQLDMTIKNNLSFNRNYSNNISNNNNDEKNKNNDQIIKLYKEGLTKREIAMQLKCSLTEVEIVIDMELDNN